VEQTECFATTGGAWLLDEQRLIAGGTINLIGASCRPEITLIES
jgi:hypothetical protein